jgi:PAS domain S-box-containing protein
MPHAQTASPAAMRTISAGVALTGVVSAVAVWLTGVESVLAAALAGGLAVLVIAAIAWFIGRRRPSPVHPWALLLAGLAIMAAGNLVFAGEGATEAFAEPSVADAVYLAGYLVIALAFLLLARALGAGRDRGDIVDGLILAAGVAVIVWALPLSKAPAETSATPTAWFAVLDLPLIDLVILATGAVIALRLGLVTRAVAFLSVAVVAPFVGDSLYAFSQMGGETDLAALVLPFALLSSAFLAAALLDPSASALAHPPDPRVPVLPRTRLALISTAAVAAAVILLVQNLRTQDPVADLVVDGLAGVIVILFAVRASVLTGALDRTQAALERNAAMLTGIADATPGAVYAGDLATMTVDYASPGLASMLGYPLEEIVGKPGFLVGIVHPDDGAAYSARGAAAVAAGRAIETFQVRWRRRDGSYRTCASNVRYQGAPGEPPTRFVAVSVDVTEQAETAARLAEREAFIAGIARAVRTLIVAGHARPGEPAVLDFVGPSVEDVLGYTPEEVIGAPGFIADRLHPDDEQFLPAIAAALARGEQAPELISRYLARDGSYRSLLISSSVSAEPDGSLRFVASGIDISDRMEAQAELERQRDFIASLLTTTPGMIVRGSLLGDRIDYVSPGIREMLGYEPGDVIGAFGWPSAHRHPDDARETTATVRAALEAGRGRFTLVERYLSAAGEWRWLLEIVNLEEPGGPSSTYVATAIDVTDRVRMEEELRAARDAAEAADRSKSEFLSIVSHELRTPLNAILGFGELLERADLVAEDRESVDYIVAAGRRLLGLIDRMLDYARLEMGRLHVAAQPVLLDDVVRLAIERGRPFAESRGSVVERGADSTAGLAAVADAGRLVSVVEDLVDNAVRHGGSGVRVVVTVRACAGDRVAIDVADNGVGMSEDQLTRVFAPLERDASGTGATLGLALSRRLVEAMGGTIRVASEVGRGTTATVEMPGPSDATEGPGRGFAAIGSGMAGGATPEARR